MIQIHVDIDNLWMYEREFGIKIHPNKEYIYTRALPVFLKLLKKTDSKATFMLIGKDLNLPACQTFCRKVIAAGHEIANHTWSHPVAFAKLCYEQKKQEIVKTHQMLTNICGKAPVGFRGPGYYQDKEIISILQKLNYRYDSSVLPGFAQLLMKTYAQIKGGENRHKTFGRTHYITSKDKRYRIKGLDQHPALLELPISVMPKLRLPIHTTFAYFLGERYRRMIVNYLKSKPQYILYLFHVIDFVDLGEQNTNHPVIPLRYSFNERMNFIADIVTVLVKINRGGIQTSRDSISKLKLL